MSNDDSSSLQRIREAQAAADKCRDAAQLAKEIYKLRKDEHEDALKGLQRIIRAETSEAPLFDRPAEDSTSPVTEPDANQAEPAPWTGAASEPDAWRHQGVGLALRTLSVPTVKKLGQAGLATVGELQDWFLANPGKSIDGLGSKSTAAVEDALVKYLDSRPVPGTGEGCRDGDEDAE